MRSFVIAPLAFLGYDLGAQAYIPLLDTSATWQDYYAAVEPGGVGASYLECYIYYLSGDTMVNDTAYWILRRTGAYWSGSVMGYNTLWYSDSMAVFLREDSSARKVFVREPEWSYEVLMYDFSIGLGPCPWTYRYPGIGYEVIAVDTVLLADGPHRRLSLDPFGWDQIIEGIGSTRGFMPHLSPILPFTSHLSCHRSDGIPNYVETLPEPTCACGAMLGMPIPPDDSFQAYPNPATDLCRLEGAPPNALFSVRSVSCGIERSGICSGSGHAVIDVSDLSPGIYVIEVLTATRPVQLKLIKQ